MMSTYDLIVIGGGPAGIAAATSAAEAGRAVVLLDSASRVGGQIWRHQHRSELPRSAEGWIRRLEESGTELSMRTSVVDARVDQEEIRVVGERISHSRGLKRIEFSGAAVVIATGARELFLPFPGWTLPGVYGIGGAQALVRGGLPISGRRVIVAGSGPLLLVTAASLVGAGAEVMLIAEQASFGSLLGFGFSLLRWPRRLLEGGLLRARLSRSRYLLGTYVESAYGNEGVEGVDLVNGEHRWREPCDILCTGYGLVPNTELADLLGCELRDNHAIVVNRYQESSVPRVYAAGEVTGVAGAPGALIEGEIAGRASVGVRVPQSLLRRRTYEAGFESRLAKSFALDHRLLRRPPPSTIICRCEDVRVELLKPDWSLREAKLFTRLGMGPCQGRICGTAFEQTCGGSASIRNSARPPVRPMRVENMIR